MSVSRDMVKQAREDARNPSQWKRLPHMRAWKNRDGRVMSDLALMQMLEQGLISRRDLKGLLP